MDLHLNLNHDGGLAEQIYTQLSQQIASGALREGTVLPSSRELAGRLAVSRATVVTAYERLAAHGLIRSRAGIGTMVSARRGSAPVVPVESPLRPRAVWAAEQFDVPDPAMPAAEFNFAPGVPMPADFPFAQWRALLSDQLRTSTEAGYADPAGSGRLRDALARHLGVSRGVRVEAGQLVITTGAQQAFDIAARVLLEPGDTVAVEDPGYRPAYRGFLAYGARVVGVPVDAEGLVVARIPPETRLVYVTPSHQFPLGMPMSESRRTELLAWAARHDAAIVEDDYDSEFRFTGRPLTPLQATDTEGRVLYVGSFSKTLLPALRVGFLGVPWTLAEAARRAKFAADYGTAGHLQAALAEFIEAGDLARHLRRMRRTYERRHDVLMSELHDQFGGVLEPIGSSGGTHTAALLTPGNTDDLALTDRARAEGVLVGALSRWGLERPGPNGFVFGYGAIPADRIRDGLAALRRVI
ncbi:PLP-dependent aminotransferase family protein [Kribbella speibonae]|uniref:PLP-dependent aminotransferase family protein n=1 Tax=Kribbella speibonae TaxID=1572660 RepID=A0A4R0IFP7_9ACTN|nr:PLP-dependent aminotransferase family protein [Kribbella speibonae]TCC30864.1 PLP-dependent aminotransferase family protein [Kribbella speibonae]